jgi:hypothetical protein
MLTQPEVEARRCTAHAEDEDDEAEEREEGEAEREPEIDSEVAAETLENGSSDASNNSDDRFIDGWERKTREGGSSARCSRQSSASIRIVKLIATKEAEELQRRCLRTRSSLLPVAALDQAVSSTEEEDGGCSRAMGALSQSAEPVTGCLSVPLRAAR